MRPRTHDRFRLDTALAFTYPHCLAIAPRRDDVPAAFARAVASGAVAVQPPTQKPWGQVVSYVRDGNGFLVERCTAVG